MDEHGGRSAAPPSVRTRFFGRREELALLRDLVGECRAITVTGPGGVGKTRLVLHHLSERTDPRQVVFVGLADLSDPALLPQAVAGHLDLHDQSDREPAEAVVDYLRNRSVLLVLDNGEHLVDACARFVDAVLHGCTAVQVITTSRQTLGIPGEQVLPLLPLPVDDDAVGLLVDRATAVQPTFERTATNEHDLAVICERLEGLPLAIELAAARLRSLSPHQVAERLTETLTLLTAPRRSGPGRQQTLRATIDWSHALCTPEEQVVWARASVFAGGFDLDAAEHVCAGDDVTTPVLDVVESLLDKSVLLREESGSRVRYRMLESLREYGAERLAATGEGDQIRRRHRDWFDDLTRRADDEWASPAQLDWMHRLTSDHANLRAALAWSLETPGEAEAALRIASRLDEYWSLVRGFNGEAQRWLDLALAATPEDHPDRALAVAVSAVYSLWQTRLDDGERRLAEAAELARTSDDPVLHARIQHLTAFARMLRAVPGTAALAADAAAVFAEHGLARRELHPLFIAGVAFAVRGEPEASARALRRMRRLTQQMDEVLFRGMAWFGTAFVEVMFGDADAAARAARQALRLYQRREGPHARAYLLDCVAWIASRRDDHPAAARLFGAASRAWEALGSHPEIAVSAPHTYFADVTRSALGADTFAAAYDAGRALLRREAIELALAATADQDPTVPLTPREAEIVDLVAQGLTNREIAARFVISPRTVDTHVQNVLGKLNLHNRAQIAAWVATSSEAVG